MPKSSLSDVSFANVTALGFSGPGAGLTNIPQSAVTGLTTALAAAGSASFPDQTGNGGKFLKTDGTSVAWVVDPVNNVLRLYKDGVLAETLGRATWTAPNAATITVGSSVNEYFTGGIHDFYAYDSVLSSEEIKAHFTAGR